MEEILHNTGVKISYNLSTKKDLAKRLITNGLYDRITKDEKEALVHLCVINLENQLTKFRKVCEELSKQGVTFDKFIYSKVVEINGKKIKKGKTLADVQQEYPNIDITHVLDKTGVDLDYDMREKRNTARSFIKTSKGDVQTQQEEKILIELGVIEGKKKERPVLTLIRVGDELVKQVFEFNNFIAKGKTLEDIAKEYPNINIEKVIEAANVDISYKIGDAIKSARESYKKQGKQWKITKEEIAKLKELKIIGIEKVDVFEEFVSILEQMHSIGVDVSKIKLKHTIRELAEESGINENQLKELGLDPEYNIGMKLNTITGIYRYSKEKMTEDRENQVVKLKQLGISLERKYRTSKEIAEASISSIKDIELADAEDVALQQLVEKTKEGGINKDEQS